MIFTLLVLLAISSVSASDDLSDINIRANDLNEGAINLDESIILDDSVSYSVSDSYDVSLGMDDSVSDSYDGSSDLNEMDETSDVSIDDEVISENENSDPVGSFMGLDNLINQSPHVEIINLTQNYRFDDSKDDLYIEGIGIQSSVTIDGQNHFIDADGYGRIFHISGNNIVLRNIAFLNGNSSALKEFPSMEYDYLGGAIYFTGENLTIENCTFENNSADSGGAVYANGSIFINNSRFINNYAIDEGGALYIGNLTNITKCTFDGNIAVSGASLFIRKQADPDGPHDDDSGDDPIDDDGPYGPDDGGDDPIDDDGPYGPDDGDDPFGPDDEGEVDPDFPDEIPDFPDELPDFPTDEGDEDADPSNMFIIDSIFRNSHNFTRGAIFVEDNVKLGINGTAFENMSAEYGSAIYADVSYSLFANNCSFKNLHANKTGGAIVLIGTMNVKFNECIFDNDTSSKNGGAIYYDANGWNFAPAYPFNICNSNFTNCSSDFGGAFVHLGGYMKIVNSSFSDNFATYDGGAVYSSQSYGDYIYNSNFSKNRLGNPLDSGLSSGGALFISYASVLGINNTEFINNSNNAIYLYSSRYVLNKSYFDKNGEAIRTIFLKVENLGENIFNSDKITNLDEDPFLVLTEIGEGIELKLINNTVNLDSLPNYFNSNDWGWISPLKNQNISGACWCFSTISVIEAGLLKSTGVLYDFSEQNIQKLLTEYSKYGNNHLVEPGQASVAILYPLSWIGPINEDEDSFDLIGKITRPISTQKIHVQDVYLIPPREESYDIDYIKQAILKCGSVTTEYYAVNEAPNFNKDTSAFYCNDTEMIPSHAVAIVGWDDNYSASNFINTPPGDGAWIIKNSYGSENYDHGFCYISYYDPVIYKDCYGVGVLFENTENYNKNYQTAFGGDMRFLNNSENYSYKNIYQAIDDDYISAVGTFFNKIGEDYSFEIYVNDVLKLVQDGVSPFYGYHTIKLETQIPIKKGDTFTVIMKTHSLPVLEKINWPLKEGVSFMDRGDGWIDLATKKATALLKVYTLDKLRNQDSNREDSQIAVKNITVTAAANGKGSLEIALKSVGGKALAYKELDVFFNNQVYKLTTDVHGIAKLSFKLNKKGKYPVNIAYLGDDNHKGALAFPTITINPVKTALTASPKTYIATLKTKRFTAKLKVAKGKALAKKIVTFTVNGKTYNAKTNAKGVATVKLRLTKAKTYTVKIKFAGDNVYGAASKSVKIKLKKEKTKLTAPKKTFKKSKKVKKVVVKLKNSKGKAIAKKKVTLTVNKKKYAAKTNKKGKATFKIKNLKKSGTTKYKVKFAGDSQYRACKKTGKIRIK